MAHWEARPTDHAARGVSDQLPADELANYRAESHVAKFQAHALGEAGGECRQRRVLPDEVAGELDPEVGFQTDP